MKHWGLTEAKERVKIQEEEIEAMPVPQQLRQLMGLPEEVSAIPQRANYKKVKVVFGPGLQPEEFKEMKEKEALQHIQQKIRNSMLSIQMQEGLLTANEDLLQTTS